MEQHFLKSDCFTKTFPTVNPLHHFEYGLILIHGGTSHYPSNLALTHYHQRHCKGMYEIEVVDGRIKQWLKHNIHGIVVTHIPTLILIRQNQPTVQFPIGHMDLLIDRISKLNSST